jgi:beta-N-acetylhexosaminidase
VLDLDWGHSGVIGDRALHGDPAAVIALANALLDGLSAAGMASCGKHFPGHGFVTADSHVAIPVDERAFADLAPDLEPFRRLPLSAVMPAHVIYPAVESLPAGFSPRWHHILRHELGFDGVVFSDDLSMEGASVAGGIVERVEAAWRAGCDMLLVCNAPDRVGELLDRWHPTPQPERAARLERLRPMPPAREFIAAESDPSWCRGRELCEALLADPVAAMTRFV